MNSETQQQPIGLPGIDVIIVGGVAGGQLVRGVNPEAQFFKLRRPDYIKPLTDSGQLDPEVAHVLVQVLVRPVKHLPELGAIVDDAGERRHVTDCRVADHDCGILHHRRS